MHHNCPNSAIHYDVGGDFKADGYNALAKDIDVNVAGDITVANLNNESENSGFGFGVSSSIDLAQVGARNTLNSSGQYGEEVPL